MAAVYIYLISSLPMLSFGLKPPFPFEHFLQMCRELLPEEDNAVLEFCDGDKFLGGCPDQPTLKLWREFEIGLRNELVKVRASRKKIDAAKYLRQDGHSQTSLYHIALNSHRIPSLMEAERFLDQERWRRLEELSFGHYFDLDTLIVYALKLRILWRWANIAGADKQEELEKILKD